MLLTLIACDVVSVATLVTWILERLLLIALVILFSKPCKSRLPPPTIPPFAYPIPKLGIGWLVLIFSKAPTKLEPSEVPRTCLGTTYSPSWTIPACLNPVSSAIPDPPPVNPPSANFWDAIAPACIALLAIAIPVNTAACDIPAPPNVTAFNGLAAAAACILAISVAKDIATFASSNFFFFWKAFFSISSFLASNCCWVIKPPSNWASKLLSSISFSLSAFCCAISVNKSAVSPAICIPCCLTSKAKAALSSNSFFFFSLSFSSSFKSSAAFSSLNLPLIAFSFAILLASKSKRAVFFKSSLAIELSISSCWACIAILNLAISKSSFFVIANKSASFLSFSESLINFSSAFNLSSASFSAAFLAFSSALFLLSNLLASAFFLLFLCC